MIKTDHILKSDVLVIGGGLAGCLAAIAAKEDLGPSAKVTVVDKGYLSRSGQSPFAAGSYTVFYPELDNADEWLEDLVRQGEYLNDQYWCKAWLERGYKVADKADKLTDCFPKDEAGKPVRWRGRAHLRTCANLYRPFKMMDGLRRQLLKMGVSIVDRVMVTDLLRNEGTVVGAMGYNFQRGEIYQFLAKALVLAASGCAFKSVYVGTQTLTGDLQVAAWDAGIEVANMENVYHNTVWKEADLYGMGRFQRLGKFINRLGEEFMWDYDPAVGNAARTPVLNLALAREIHDGRGPVYLDLRQAPQKERDLARKVLPTVFRMFDRKGQSPFDEPKEWMPAMGGSTRCGGGIFLSSLDCETNLPGVFAGGDICWQAVQGEYSFGGVNIGFTAVSGDTAGHSAARFVANNSPEMPREVSRELLSEMLSSRFAPLSREKGLDPVDVAQEIRKCIIPYNLALIKTSARLNKALERVRQIKDEMMPNLKAGSVRDLGKVFEDRSMLTLAELMLTASLLREESRGFHFREEFPYTDNENWLKLIVLKREADGEVKVRTSPIETPFIKPLEKRSVPPGVKKPRKTG